MNKRLVVSLTVVAVVLVGAALVGWRVAGSPSTYAQATDVLPASTLRALYTDWSAVREVAHGSGLGAGSSQRDVNAFLRRAYDRDLTSASAISDSTYTLQRRYGVSPLDAEWESYGQSRQGAVDVLKVDDSVDLAGVERNLRTLGYQPPARGSGTGGVWQGSGDLVARIGSSLTPVQQNVVVLSGPRVVLMSDSAAYASSTAEVVRGDRPSLASAKGVGDLTGLGQEPANAVLWASDFACVDLSMGHADEEDQRVADRLVARAGSGGGNITPLSGLLMAHQADGALIVAMHFESSDQASENLQARTDLAVGPAPGQGGTFRQRFTVTSAQARGADVILRFRPRGDEPLLSDLYDGPVLFATC